MNKNYFIYVSFYSIIDNYISYIIYYNDKIDLYIAFNIIYFNKNYDEINFYNIINNFS